MFRLAPIGVKEAVASGITKLVGVITTNHILPTADGTAFKNVDEYDIAALIKALIHGAERPEAANICRQFVNLAAK